MAGLNNRQRLTPLITAVEIAGPHNYLSDSNSIRIDCPVFIEPVTPPEMFSRQDLISTESQADFDQHRDRILADLSPLGAMESMLAERIVSLSRRLRHILNVQNESIEVLKEDYVFWKFTRCEKPDDINSIPFITGRAYVRNFKINNTLDRLLVYEHNIENSLYKAILEFKRFRTLRNTNRLESDDRKTSE